jgi:hypothetical protein
MGLQRVPIQLPLKGWNVKGYPLGLEPSEASLLENVVPITPRGEYDGLSFGEPYIALTTREGFAQASEDSATIAQGAAPQCFEALYWEEKNKIISSGIDPATAAPQVRYATPGTASLHTILTTGGSVSPKVNGLVIMPDSANTSYLWMNDGINTPQKWTGAGATAAWANTPPLGAIMCVWKNRMIISGVAAQPQRIFYSDIGNPESPAASYGTNWIDIRGGDDTGEAILGLVVTADKLMVFKARSIWEVFDDSTFDNRRVTTTAVMPTALPGSFTAAGDLGALFTSTDSSLQLIDSSGEVRNLTPNIKFYRATRGLFCAFLDGTIFVAGRSTASGSLSNVWQGIPVEGERFSLGWFKQTMTPVAKTFLSATHPTMLPVATTGIGVLFIANFNYGAYTNQIFQMYHPVNGPLTTDDGGVNFTARWRTRWNKYISEEAYERIRRLNVVHEGRLTVKTFIDLEDDASVYTEEKADLTGDDEPRLQTWHPETRGRYHMIEFTNEGHPGDVFKIYAAEAAIRGGKEH